MITDATARRLDQRRSEIATTYSKGIRNVGEFNGYIRCMEVVHGGSQVWTAEQDGSISVRKGMSGAVHFTIPRKRDVFVHCLLAQNFYVWVGMSDGYLRIYNVENNELVLEIKQHAGAVTSLIGHCGRVFSGSADWQIFAWDGKAPEQNPEVVKYLAQFSGHQNTVRCLAVDERSLFSGGDDCTIRCWDIDTANERSTPFPILGHKSPVSALLVHHVHLISASHDHTIKIWNSQTALLVKTLDLHNGPVISLLKDPSSDRMWSGGTDGVVAVWDLTHFRLVTKLHDHSGTIISSMRVLCRVNAMKVWTVGSNGVVKVWYSETEMPDVDYSEMNKLEEEMQGTIEAMRGTIIQNYQELERRKDQLKRLEGMDDKRKRQLALALGRGCQAQLMRRSFAKLLEWFAIQKQRRQRPQMAELLARSTTISTTAVYYHKWYAWWSQRKDVQRRIDMTRSLARMSNQSLTEKYMKKLLEYLKYTQFQRKKHVVAAALERSTKVTLALRYMNKLRNYAASSRARRKAKTVSAVMAQSAERSLATLQLQRLVNFARAEHQRERRYVVADTLERATALWLAHRYWRRWMCWATWRRARMRGVKAAQYLERKTHTMQLASCFRKWSLWKELRKTHTLVGSRDAEQNKLSVLRGNVDQYVGMTDEDARQTLQRTQQQLQTFKRQVDTLREQNERLTTLNHMMTRELRGGPGDGVSTGLDEQLFNVMSVLKARAINVYHDCKLINDTREHARRNGAVKLFTETFLAVKKTSDSHNADGSPTQLSPAARRSAVQGIKEMVIAFDCMSPTEKSHVNVGEDVVHHLTAFLAILSLSEGVRASGRTGKKSPPPM